MIVCKRIYEQPSTDDGYRVLVDRLWPRGMKREKAAIDEWLKDLAPSNEVRHLAVADPAKWSEFERHYRTELSQPHLQPTLERLREIARSRTVTLLFAKRDEQHNNAVVLKAVLDAGRQFALAIIRPDRDPKVEKMEHFGSNSELLIDPEATRWLKEQDPFTHLEMAIPAEQDSSGATGGTGSGDATLEQAAAL